MANIYLTIAIPTYNRADLLIESLNSVVDQISDGVEVLINDNASTDNTEEVVRTYLAKHSFLKYSKNSSNIGPDANFLSCLQKSKGSFVQLLSDDDILLPGAVNKILTTILINPGASVIRTNCCSFLKSFNLSDLTSPAYGISEDIYFNNKNKFLEYVGYASVFMSTTVYNRRVFDEIKAPEKYIGTCLLQTHLIFECLAKNQESIILSDVCVAARVGMPVGFSMVKVLVVEWKNVLYSTCVRNQYNKQIIDSIYNNNIRTSFPPIIRDAHMSESSYGSVFKVIFSATWMFPGAWLFLYPYALLPKLLLGRLSFVKKIFR